VGAVLSTECAHEELMMHTIDLPTPFWQQDVIQQAALSHTVQLLNSDMLSSSEFVGEFQDSVQ
jgi:hypothetical protein